MQTKQSLCIILKQVYITICLNICLLIYKHLNRFWLVHVCSAVVEMQYRFCHDESISSLKILKTKTIFKSFHHLIFIYVFNNDSISLWNLKNIVYRLITKYTPPPIVFLFTQKWICWSITLHVYMNNDHNNVWNQWGKKMIMRISL